MKIEFKNGSSIETVDSGDVKRSKRAEYQLFAPAKKKRKLKERIDYVLQTIQLYSYLLPGNKIGNSIMDFRMKHTLPHDKR